MSRTPFPIVIALRILRLLASTHEVDHGMIKRKILKFIVAVSKSSILTTISIPTRVERSFVGIYVVSSTRWLAVNLVEDVYSPTLRPMIYFHNHEPSHILCFDRNHRTRKNLHSNHFEIILREKYVFRSFSSSLEINEVLVFLDRGNMLILRR